MAAKPNLADLAPGQGTAPANRTRPRPPAPPPPPPGQAVLKTAGGPTIWEGGDNKGADLSGDVVLATEFTD
jgi:hypothetical protein